MTLQPPKADRRAWAGLAVLSLPALLVTMDISVLFLAVPALSADLEPSSTELLWISDSYGFLIAGALITMGTLGDRIGRRRLLMIGAVAFAGASLLAAFSTSAPMLIVSRALLGVAGATLAPSSMALIRGLFPDERQRTLATGVWMSCFAAGAAVGPLVGGALLEHFWWGSVFLLNVPVMALLLVLVPRLLTESAERDPRPFDLAGAALLVVALLTGLYGVKRLAEQGMDTFTAAGIAAGIAAGVAFGVAFVRHQASTTHPLLDLRLFRMPALTVAVAAMVLATFVMAGMLLFFAQYLQLVRGMGPFEAGAWSVPVMLGSVAGSMLAPALSGRLRPVVLLATAMTIAAAGLAVMSVADGPILAALVGGTVLMGLGAGAIGTVATDVIVGTAPPERAGAASGLSETGGELGGALGIALLGSVGTVVYRARVSAQTPADLPAGAAESVRNTLGAAHQAGDVLPAPVLDAANTAFVDAMQAAALTGTLLMAGTAAVAALLARRGSVPAPRG